MNRLTLSAQIWIVVAAITSAIALPLIKQYNTTHNYIYLVLAAISQMVLVASYVFILRTSNMTTIYPFLKILSVMIVALFGFFIFQEHITIENGIGIVLCVIALYFLIE